MGRLSEIEKIRQQSIKERRERNVQRIHEDTKDRKFNPQFRTHGGAGSSALDGGGSVPGPEPFVNTASYQLSAPEFSTVRLPQFTHWFGGETQTFSIWVYRTFERPAYILSQNLIGGEIMFEVRIVNADTIVIAEPGSDPIAVSIGFYNETRDNFRIGGWFHLAIVLDGTIPTARARIRVYVNGEELLNQPPGIGMEPVLPNPVGVQPNPLIGQCAYLPAGPEEFSNIIVNNFSSWKEALSPYEVSKLAEGPNDLKTLFLTKEPQLWLPLGTDATYDIISSWWEEESRTTNSGGETRSRATLGGEYSPPAGLTYDVPS